MFVNKNSTFVNKNILRGVLETCNFLRKFIYSYKLQNCTITDPIVTFSGSVKTKFTNMTVPCVKHKT